MTTDDNSELFAQRRECLLCEETFTLGEMYPGKTYTAPLQCPYCRHYETRILSAPSATRSDPGEGTLILFPSTDDKGAA